MNLKDFALAGLLTVGLLGVVVCAGAAAPAPADFILRGGEIRHPGGWAGAMAIRRGVILAVGDEASMAALRGPDTQVVDLAGATVLPGLHDLHVHGLGAGLTQLQCRFAQGLASAKVVAVVKDCVALRKPGEWISGGQWDTASLRRSAHRSQLDAVSAQNPVALTDISLHSLWVNSRALELAGITRDTRDPENGVIERDARGEPTGVLRESAVGLVSRMIPPATQEQKVTAVRWSMDTMLSYGITSFTDALADESALAAYAAVADAGQLKLRMRACQPWRVALTLQPGGSEEDISPFLINRNLYGRERLRPDCIKMLLDGVPTDSHTAAMLEPYADAKPGDARARGFLMIPASRLNAGVTRFDANGFTVKMHAAGDAAVRAALDAIAAARAANGFTGVRHDVSHNSFIHLDDIGRARAIAATFEMSPYIWFDNPTIPDVQKAIGSERMLRWTPVKDAIDGGALVVAGSDWSVVPSVNPWLAIETLVTRLPPGAKDGKPLGASQRITLDQAFELFTVNSATHMGQRDQVGVIAPGMLADIVVVERNPWRIPISEVHSTRVLMTLVGGEVVYRAAR
jgi:predicted amidohydrolase YtcJ